MGLLKEKLAEQGGASEAQSQTDDSSFAAPFLSPSQHTLILSQFLHLSAYMRVSNDICEEYFHEALLKLVKGFYDDWA